MKPIDVWRREAAPDWAIVREGYSPETEGVDETLLTLTNGRYGCRGSLPLASAHRDPGVYLAGVYDKPDRPADTDAYGLQIRDKAITPAYAVAPLWNGMDLDVDGAVIDFLNAGIERVERVLDLQRGLLIEQFTLSGPDGQPVVLRLLSAALLTAPGGMLVRCELETPGRAADVRLRFRCEQPEAPVCIPRLKDYITPTRLERIAAPPDDAPVQLTSRVTLTGRQLTLTARTQGWMGGLPLARRIERLPHGVAETFRFRTQPDAPAVFDRRCTIAADPEPDAIPTGDADNLLDAHTAAWAAKWDAGDVRFEGDRPLLTALRWNLFSLHALGHFHSPDWSISATGLHGQGYFGHVFWDTEMFLLPFYCLTHPAAARDLLAYRCDRLDGARRTARALGFRGAKFPWTSTADGDDVCPPDWERCGRRQIHNSAAIAYALCRYREWTGDDDFFLQHGVEVIAETARFYRSRMTAGEDGRLHLLDVIGPDEYNLHADDNAYTNALAAWNLRTAVAAMAELRASRTDDYSALTRRIGWTDAEAAALQIDADRVVRPRIRDGVIEQYRGFFDLRDPGPLPRDADNMPTGNLHAYDSGCQLIKQADAVMLTFLFPDAFPTDVQRATFDYYERRNTFGSSLSPAISCIMGLRLGRARHAASHFRLTCRLDLDNRHIDRNTPEGIHAACAGGACLAALLGFGGIRIQNGCLTAESKPPAMWQDFEIRLTFRGQPVMIRG